MIFPFHDEIILQDDRVLLHPVQQEDVANLLEVATAHEDVVMFSSYRIHTEDYLRSFISNALQAREAKKRYAFTIYDKHANVFAGSTSYMNIEDVHLRLEIGMTWIGRQFQRTGLNRRTKLLLLDYAFDVLGCLRVEFVIDERNAQSRTAVEAIGGTLDGIIRSHSTGSDGFRRNAAVYSILENEWRDGLREKLREKTR